MIPNEHEYKVMGLAPYHTGTAMKEVESVFDNMQSLDGLEFKFDSSIKDIFDHLSRNLRDYRFDQIAAGLQSFTEKMLVKWFQNAVEYYNVESVVFSGGVSLNVKANSSIAKLSKIKKFFVCGGGGDESIHMGACYTYAESLGIQPKPLENLYLGPNASYDDNDLKIFEKHNITKFDNVDQILEKILAGKIIATCIGRMEMGPRALCNRSILADPRHTKNVQIINKMIKSRDFWMPFAPVILSEYQDELIENPKNIDAPHMTVAFNTIKGIDKIPAAIHQYDHTARAQLLKKEVNPLVWELIKKFHTKTGVPSLLNTSFNLHGYPLVNTIQDAAYVFENSGLEILWLDRHIIEKNSAIIQ
jgi:carbamoyltransferase